MKFTSRNTRKIALAVSLCISTSLAPQAAISMPAEMQGTAALGHSHGSSALSTEDMVHLFGNKANGSENSRFAYMTEKDMQQTEGKAGPVDAIAGATLGGLSYLGSATVSDSWSTAAFIGSVVGGGVGGFFTNPFVGAYVGGMAGELAGNACSSCHATYTDKGKRY